MCVCVGHPIAHHRNATAHVVKPDLCCGHSSHAQSSRVQVVLGPWSPCCRKQNLSIETIVCAIYESATRKPQPRRPPVEASPRCIGDVMPRPWLFTRIAVQVQVGNGEINAATKVSPRSDSPAPGCDRNRAPGTRYWSLGSDRIGCLPCVAL